MSSQVAGNVLDVGCGCKPYESMFRCKTYVGLELDTPANRSSKRADHYYDGNTFPFQKELFDTVICNQVLEHVFNPEVFLSEINRVLRPGGGLLITVPFIWDEHEKPWDYARYTSFGLKHLLQKHGFEVVCSKKCVNHAGVLAQLTICYLMGIFSKPSLRSLRPVLVFPIIAFNLIGLVCAALSPRADDMYLDGAAFCRKISIPNC